MPSDESSSGAAVDLTEPAPPAPPDPVDADDARLRPLALAVPVWFEIGLLAAVLGVVCCGGFGLGLAIIGRYSFALSVGVGLPVALLATALGARFLVGRAGERPDRTGGTAPAVAVLAVVAAQVLWNGVHAGNWINTDRDPATYAVLAKWLTRHPTLWVNYQGDWTGTGLNLRGEQASIYDMNGQLQFQFNHLLSVLLAQAGALGGDRALLAGNAVLAGLGLLVLYAVGVRLVNRPWIVAVAVAALGLALPVVYTSRASFSESVTMTLVWAGVWLLVAAWDRGPLVLGVLGGAALGASTMARIDAVVYLVVLPLLAAAVALFTVDTARWRRIAVLSGAVVVGAAAPVAIGTVDIVKRSGRYYGDLATSIQPLQKAAVVALVVGVVLVLTAPLLRAVTRPLGRVVARRSGPLAVGLGVVTVVGFVLDWTARPALFPQYGPGNTTVANLQRAEGLTVDAGRTYSEQGMTWLGWYLGAPMLVLAVLGLGLLVARAVKVHPAALTVLGVAGAGTVFYLYKISNTPDQLFGPRRYVPAVLPLFALAAALALAVLHDRLPAALGARAARFARPVTALVLGVVLVFPVSTAWRVRDMSPRQGQLAVVDSVCRTLGPDAAVLFPAASYGLVTYPQTVRSWCDVPTVATITGPSAEQIEQVADVMAGKGRTLWVIDSEPDQLAGRFGAQNVVLLGRTLNPKDPAVTLTRPPLYYGIFDRSWYGVRVPRG